MIKKINAISTWILIVCLLGHLATMSYSLLSGWYDFFICKTLARLTGGVFLFHVILSLLIVFRIHDGGPIIHYPKQNKKTVLQRDSGILMIALVYFHIHEYSFIVSGTSLSLLSKLRIIGVELLFWASLFAHLAISFSKSLISLGLIRTETAEKIIDRVAMIVCIILMMITCFAMIRFVVMW